MATVTIHHPDNSTETIDGTVGWRDRQEVGAMRRVRVTITRDQFDSVSIAKRSDELSLSTRDDFQGPITNIKANGATYTLTARSTEWYAKRYPPLDGGSQFTGTDSDIFADLTQNVSEWFVGVSGDEGPFTGSLEYVFSQALRHEALRKLEQNVPGELQWTDNGLVKYLDRLGEDRSSEITLSATNGTLEGDITITEDSDRLDVTHLRIVGASEGEAQYRANLVPQADPNTYPNEIRYTQPRWDDADDTVWGRRSNKDISSDTAMDETAGALADELTSELVEAKATATGDTLNVGDTVHVQKPEQGLDRDMRVHRLVTRTDEDTPAAVVQEVMLSTRTVVRSDPNEEKRDTQRFNIGYQGSSMWATPSGGLQPVASGTNYLLPFYYPEVEFEHRSELWVRSLPARAFVGGIASDGPGNTGANSEYGVIARQSNSSSVLSLGGTWTSVASFSPGAPTAGIGHHLSAKAFGDAGDVFEFQARLVDGAGNYYPNVGGASAEMHVDSEGTPQAESFTLQAAGDFDGETVDLEVRINSISGSGIVDGSVATDWFALEPHTHTVSDHTHTLEAGVTEFASDTAGSVDVLVNGVEIETNIGDGEFTEQVNLTGEFTQDAWNLVELTSSTAGLLIGVMSLEAYRQLGTNPFS